MLRRSAAAAGRLSSLYENRAALLLLGSGAEGLYVKFGNVGRSEIRRY